MHRPPLAGINIYSEASLEGWQERARMSDMVRMIVLLILLVAFVVGYPLLHERTASACNALAFRAMDRAGATGDMSSPAASSLLARLVDGPGTADYARRRIPYLPAFLTCAALYWQTVIDPRSVTEVWADLGGDELRRSTPTVGAEPKPPYPPPLPAAQTQDYSPPSRSAPAVPSRGSPSHVDMNRSFNQPQGGDTDRLFGKPQGGCKNQLDQDGYRC